MIAMPKPPIDAIAAARAILLRITEPTRAGQELRRRIKGECARQGEPLTHQALYEWRKLQRGVPAGRMHAVAKVLGLSVRQVRPDLFPRKMRVSRQGEMTVQDSPDAV